MRKIYLVFGAIVIFKQIFTFSIPIFSIPFLGRDVNTVMFYFFIGISLLIFLFDCFQRNRIHIRDFCLLCYIFTSILGSLLNWKNFTYFVSDACLFLMPIAVYIWVVHTEITFEVFVKIFGIVSILAATVSVLVSIGILDVGIWAAEGDYVRAAGAINSTFGVGSIIIASVLIFNSNKNEHSINIFLLYSMLISGFIIVLLSFSRTRWILCATLFVSIFLSTFKRNVNINKFGALRIICFILVALFFVKFFSPEFFDKIFEQMSDRFEKVTIGDHSITYRGEEADLQMKLFWQNPFFGSGWGSLSSKGMYTHAIYPALLAQSGIFALCYLIWYFSVLFSTIKFRKTNKDSPYIQISLLLQFALFVLNLTNSGFIVSGGYIALAMIFIVEKSLFSIEKQRRDMCEDRNTNFS